RRVPGAADRRPAVPVERAAARGRDPARRRARGAAGLRARGVAPVRHRADERGRPVRGLLPLSHGVGGAEVLAAGADRARSRRSVHRRLLRAGAGAGAMSGLRDLPAVDVLAAQVGAPRALALAAARAVLAERRAELLAGASDAVDLGERARAWVEDVTRPS